MPTNSLTAESTAEHNEAQKQVVRGSRMGIEVGLLTGCQDRPYAFGLAMALASKVASLDVIGSDEIDSPEFHSTPNLRFLNFRGSQKSRTNFADKLSKLIVYYVRLIRFAARSKPEILHILWNYKLEYFDRTILMLYFKALGKKVALTAHNVNQAKRDSNDSWLNRTTLKIQYRFSDHIFVHTQKMKDELCRDFGVAEKAVTVIQYPIDNSFPDTDLTPAGAKRRLGLRDDEKAVLFFGRIRPYKGLEFLLDAFRLLLADKQAN
jgi:glycosyltransferase involved in cell wall biosynthesis